MLIVSLAVSTPAPAVKLAAVAVETPGSTLVGEPELLRYLCARSSVLSLFTINVSSPLSPHRLTCPLIVRCQPLALVGLSAIKPPCCRDPRRCRYKRRILLGRDVAPQQDLVANTGKVVVALDRDLRGSLGGLAGNVTGPSTPFSGERPRRQPRTRVGPREGGGHHAGRHLDDVAVGAALDIDPRRLHGAGDCDDDGGVIGVGQQIAEVSALVSPFKMIEGADDRTCRS